MKLIFNRIALNYLSYGKHLTGGYVHEQSYLNWLAESLETVQSKVDVKVIRHERLFESPLAYVSLLWLGFKDANATHVVVVGRMALTAILRNMFNKNQVHVVMHYEDERDGRSGVLKLYFKLLFVLMRWKSSTVKLVVVARFWEDYFRTKHRLTNIVYFPNRFDRKLYKGYDVAEKKMQVHLGQWSWKNDKAILGLAVRLHAAGFTCYFSTNDAAIATKTECYEIRFRPFETYLQEMAESMYTLALTQINEGWNRVAHESFLVHTQVIGYDAGGLGELLKGANGLIAKNAEEVYDLIVQRQQKPIQFAYLKDFYLPE